MADPVILTFFAAMIALFVASLHLKFQGGQQNVFQKHYIIVRIAVGVLVMLWCLFGIKVKCPGVYQAYARNLPFDLEFCAFLSISSIDSLLLSESLMPLVFFLYPISYVKILYWVFNKLEDAFEDRPAVLGKKGRSSSVLAGASNSIESSSMAEPVIITFSAAIITFFLGWLQLKFQDSHQNLFQEHSTVVSIAVGSLVMLWCLFVIYVKCARLCQVYARNLPFDVDFFAFLSIASTCSLLLPHSLVFVLYLSPSVKILYWVFDKLEDAFEDKQFWAKRFDPVLSRPKIPLQASR